MSTKLCQNPGLKVCGIAAQDGMSAASQDTDVANSMFNGKMVGRICFAELIIWVHIIWVLNIVNMFGVRMDILVIFLLNMLQQYCLANILNMQVDIYIYIYIYTHTHSLRNWYHTWVIWVGIGSIVHGEPSPTERCEASQFKDFDVFVCLQAWHGIASRPVF